MDDKDDRHEKDGTYEDRQRSIELLNETHTFPCPVMIKVIGNNNDDFISRIVKVIREHLHLKFDPPMRFNPPSGEGSYDHYGKRDAYPTPREVSYVRSADASQPDSSKAI